MPRGSYHITGTCGHTSTSNTHSWQKGDLTAELFSLDLDMQSIVRITPDFLSDCFHLQHVNLASLRSFEALPEGFLNGRSLEEADLSPLLRLREVGIDFFLGSGKGMKSMGRFFLSGCTEIRYVDLSQC